MASQSPYVVIPFEFEEFVKLISASSEIYPKPDIKNNNHVLYLFDYLNDLGAKTVVLESRYIDHDYLEDFAGYYVRCFNKYRRTTSRLHFFSESFDSSQFRRVILKTPNGILGKKLIKSYLGFLVIKPLPQTIIGRTCIKTYPDDNNRRHFPVIHKYNANLFGLNLTVDSLAYQEQDKVVAACATSALWSVFQGSGKLFHHAIPSPVEITKAACIHIPDSGALPHETRTLHHGGLTATQIAHGIRSVGMEPYLIGANHEYVLKCTLYAYLRAKIPALIGIHLINQTNNEVLGAHAVVATGYSLGHAAPIAFNGSSFLNTASRIDKVYVHDDQIGPFAKMTFSANNKMLTAWPDNQGVKGNIVAQATMIVIPLYHKIRIPFQVIHDITANIDLWLDLLRTQKFISIAQRLEWDIYLTDVNQFKVEISKNQKVSAKAKSEALLINMPKYLWRSTALVNNTKLIDILFDATDIEQGAIVVMVLVYDTALSTQLKLLAPIISARADCSGSTKTFFDRISNPPSFSPIE